MGVFDKLRESIFKVRVVPKQTAEDSTSFVKEKDSASNKIQEAIDAGKRLDLSDLTNIGILKGTRNQKYAIFEEMVADGRIGAAIEMYANDTVQYNAEGKVIWVESKNTDVAKYANKLIEDLNIAQNLWSYAYCMWLYGDVFIELFENTSTSGKKPTLLYEPINSNQNVRTQKEIQGAKLERYVEKVPNAADIYDLQIKGKTCGYIRSEDNNDYNYQTTNNTYIFSGLAADIDILSPTKFVHICLSPNINRFPERFKLIDEPKNKKVREDGTIEGSENNGSLSGNLSFSVKTGESILENVYAPYQTLKLKEDSVLLERITKSSITRVIQVELGDLPESQKKKRLQELKNQIEQQINLNKDTGNIQSRAGAQPVENIIYTTTKNGKGAISTVNIGGDAEIGNTEDINQSENKLFGSLLTPKASLGADMDGTGLSNGGSLTELNTTYARRIKRGQIAIITAIRDLINIFALNDGLVDVVNNFEVKLTPIITVEDNRRDELLKDKITNVNDVLALFDGIDKIDEDTKLNMLIEWLSNYLNQQDIVNIINERLQELEAEEDEEAEITEDNTDYEMSPNDGASSFDEPSFDADINNDNFEEPSNEEPNLEVPEQTDLADIEGQDLL